MFCRFLINGLFCSYSQFSSIKSSSWAPTLLYLMKKENRNGSLFKIHIRSPYNCAGKIVCGQAPSERSAERTLSTWRWSVRELEKKRDLSIEVSLESFYLCKTQVFSFRARRQGNDPRSVLLVRGGEMIPNQRSGHFSHETCTPNHRFGQGFKERVVRSQQRHVRKRQVLLDYFSYNAGSYCPSAFSDRKSQSFFDSDRCDQADCHCDVVSRHAHLSSFR